ncbi:hypothetical protein A3K72_01000 [Candidatus Woesearchaeota archaeon RBG_13_36_6]|nr:MAG: hypothetical protein A3K72_01000 [Candidatus Woesearchaeota archaeon RBG_13_36_6]HJX50567.1 radical SAM protein [Candidatus Nanoarchaeia archaeon]
MQIKNVLLVNLWNVGEKVGTVLPPLGLMYLGSVLEENDYKVKIIDGGAFDYSDEEIISESKKFNPHILGVYCNTSGFKRVMGLCRKFKRVMNIPTIIGGPHAIIQPEEIIVNDCVDYVATGEGEITLPELLYALNNHRPLKNILGVYYKRWGKIHKNPRRPFIENLDSIPFPARHLVEMDKYYIAPHHYKRKPIANMIASRGCPYSCSFCSSSKMWGHRYRVRSVENVIEEIKFLIKEHGVKEVGFWDDLFGANKEWVHKFCDQLIKEKINITWYCEFRVNCVDPDLLKKMKKAGCWCILYGFESMNQLLLDSINKRCTVQQIRNAIKWSKEAGIEIRANYILGLPNETPEIAKAVIKEICKANPSFVKFTLLTPFPGTQLYDDVKAGKWGNMLDESDKLTNHIANFKPYGYESLEQLESIYHYAYMKFYFRPKYIASRLFSIRSVDDIKKTIHGAGIIVKKYIFDKFSKTITV